MLISLLAHSHGRSLRLQAGYVCGMDEVTLCARDRKRHSAFFTPHRFIAQMHEDEQAQIEAKRQQVIPIGRARGSRN